MPIVRCACFLFLAAVLPATRQQSATPPVQAKATDPGDVDVDPLPTDRPVNPGGKVKMPVVLYTAAPEFSQQAKDARFSGQVLVYLWIDKKGNPTHVRVVRGVGMGLDENAVAAVRQYKFKPATLDGQPVVVDLYVEVNFHVL